MSQSKRTRRQKLTPPPRGRADKIERSNSVPLRTTIRIFTVFSMSCLPRVGIRAPGYSTLFPSYLWKGVCSFPRVF